MLLPVEPVPEDTIVVQRRSTTTLSIVWNAEGLSGQLIRYRRVDSDDAEQSVSASGNTATLTNLLPGTLYSFQLGISGFTAASGIGRTGGLQGSSPGTALMSVSQAFYLHCSTLGAKWVPSRMRRSDLSSMCDPK